MASSTGRVATPSVDPVTDERPSDPPSQTRPRAFAALRDRNFARYWTTLALSLTGTWVRITAMGFLVYEITGDPFKLAMINVAMAAPQLIGNLVAGNILDHVDRRRVLVGVQVTYMAMMALLVALVVADTIQYWHLVVISIVTGIAVGFDWPARLSLVPSLVPREQMQSAIALNATAFNSARILGPTLGGWLIATVGLAACFGFTLAAAAPYAIVLLTLSIVRPQEHKPRGNAFAMMREGYGYIWKHTRIRSLMSVEIVPIALGMSYVTLAPAVASDILDTGSRGLGYMLAAVGIGSLVGSVLVAWFSGVRHRGTLVIISVGVFGTLFIVYALSSSMLLTLPIMFLMGLTTAFYSTIKETLIQTLVDDGYRGRVMATNSIFWSFTPVGALLAGAMAAVFGLQVALAINGVLVLLYAPLLWFATPVRTID
ncbi:MAG TPA: MFS transporter [Thermomicrobiales bacterium]|nr:MFS transporter [Thermomicrobiales bacterium]